MHYCIVEGCNNRSQNTRGIKFYTLPLQNKVLLHKWLKAIPLKQCKRVNEHSRICSEHFVGKRKRNRHDTPSIFPQKTAIIKRTVRKNNIVDKTECNVTTKKWPKVITKVRHDHTYARVPSQAPAEHCNSISFNNPKTYLTVIEGCDLVSPLNITTVKAVGVNTYNSTMQDASTSTESASASSSNHKTHDIGVEVNNFYF